MEAKSAEGKFGQNQWVIQIRECLEYVAKEETPEFCSVSVFNVPKELLAVKPETYIPQTVSIGPYHHWKSEVYESERYKVAAARKVQKNLNSGLTFNSVVEEFRKLEWRIRSCYYNYVPYDGETLAWLMALDASFVLECLQFYVDVYKSEGGFLKQLGPTLDPRGRSATYSAILRDMMMLENQIPLFLLEKLLEMQSDSKHKAEELLCNLANRACRELSPFMFALPQITTCNLRQRAHLLELLYHVLVPTSWQLDETVAEGNEPAPISETETPALDSESLKQDATSLWTVFSSLNVGPLRHFLRFGKRVSTAKPVRVFMKLPWPTPASILNFIISVICKEKEASDSKDGAVGSSSQCWIPPSPDELAIPSASDLCWSGVKFAPADGDLTTIRFDEKKATLYLPPITLDTNAEVTLRNLMAFEERAAPGAFIFTHYIDFMNGMIDTEEDVRLLRNKGIIYSHPKNDGEVANLWNGIGKCARPSRVQYLDKVVGRLNKYYRSRWNVAVAEYASKYIFPSWKLFSVLASILLLLFTCVQAFCSVYECKKGISNIISIDN